MRWFFFVFKLFLGLPLRLMFPFRIIGRARLPKKDKYVSISNHLSGRDVVTLGIHLRGFRYFLAKKELSKKRFLGSFLKMLGAVYIDRDKMDLKAIKTSIACLKDAPLSVFPEGTRNKSGDGIQEVKGGAAMIAVKAGVDIVPIMIHHKTKALRRNYMFIGERITLPFSTTDRFNNEAMATCTAIVTENMLKAKDMLDGLVKDKSYKEYDKQLKARLKADKAEKKAETATAGK